MVACSQTANAMRSHMAEMGIVAATGMTSIAKLIVMLRDDEDTRLPNAARTALLEMADPIETLTTRIEKLDRKILATVKAADAARRLTSIPGVGPPHCRNDSSNSPGSLELPHGPPLRPLDRDNTESPFERRQRASRQNIEAGQQATMNAADRRRHLDPQADSPWSQAAGVDRIADGATAVQGGCRDAGQQDGSHDLGASRQGRHLPSAGNHRENIGQKESRRPGSGMKWQGAKSVMNPRDDTLDTDQTDCLNVPSSASK